MLTWIFLALVTPNLLVTPGVIRPLSQQQICSIKWGRDVRHVTTDMKKIVFASYSLDYKDHRLYEVDHLIPRELGGADDIKNLWPQILTEARMIKDPEENRLHRAVCAGTIPLVTAQEQMRQWGK